jgi:hypothetical protein
MRAFFAGASVEQLARALCDLDERPGRVLQIARVVLRIRGMSPEAKAQLREQRRASGGSAFAIEGQDAGSREFR